MLGQWAGQAISVWAPKYLLIEASGMQLADGMAFKYVAWPTVQYYDCRSR